MAKHRELSWQGYAGKRKGGRWFKVINGKRRYYGTAKSKRDHDAY